MMIGARMTLLLVDDEEGIRTVLSALLEDMGYDVVTASGGREALAVFREKRPPLVMTDIKMAGMDGITLLKELKALSPEVEVLMLTGHGDMDLAVTSLRFGAGDFLNKPVSDEALEVALNRARERIALREALRRHTEELEELVAERTRELIRSERFAAVGETAATLAHAIKNIAGALEGTMYVLEKGIELNRREHLEEGWSMIRADIARLYALAVGLLDLGRPLKLEFRPTVPGRLARQVLELVARKAGEAGVRLELLDEAGNSPVSLAEESVHQCLLNLVLNSLESFGFIDAAFLPGHGVPAGAETARPPAAPAVSVKVAWELKENGEKVLCYTVSDNGPGMPDWMEANPGESLQSGKKTGSGIGLFATRRITREIGAELRLMTRPGEGTSAMLLLPCV